MQGGGGADRMVEVAGQVGGIANRHILARVNQVGGQADPQRYPGALQGRGGRGGGQPALHQIQGVPGQPGAFAECCHRLQQLGFAEQAVVGQLLQAGQALGAQTVFTAEFKKRMIIFLFIVTRPDFAVEGDFVPAQQGGSTRSGFQRLLQHALQLCFTFLFVLLRPHVVVR